MENKTSKKIKILLAVILLLFVVPSSVDFVAGFSSGWKDFKRGFNAGQEQARGVQSFFVKLNRIGDEETPKEFDGGMQFFIDGESGRLTVPERTASAWWVDVVNVFLSLTVFIFAILFVCRLIRFTVKLPRRPIMGDESIRALSGIGYSLGILSLSGYLIEITQYVWLWNHIALDGYEIRMGLPPASLIVALIILAMTEILRAGTKLQKEQELTI